MVRQLCISWHYRRSYYQLGSQLPGSMYNTWSLQAIIQVARRLAGIRKPGSMPMLGFGFASHLLERGEDVVFIQKLIRYNDIRQRYDTFCNGEG